MNFHREAILKEYIPWLADKFVYAIPLNIDERGFHDAMAIQIGNQIRRLVQESIISIVRYYIYFLLYIPAYLIEKYKFNSNITFWILKNMNYLMTIIQNLYYRFLTKYKFDPKATFGKESLYGYSPETLKRLFGFIPRTKDEPSSQDHNCPPFFINLKNDMGKFRY